MEPEENNKPEGGIFVRRRTLFLAGIFFAVAFIVLTLLVHTMLNCTCGRAKQEVVEETPETSTLVSGTIEPPLTNLRLPNNVRPHHYQLRMQPFLENFTFAGKVVIHIECIEDTETITLHAFNLSIIDVNIKLSYNDSGTLQITSYEFDVPREFVVFTLNEPLKASNFYNLSMRFNGELNDDLTGFYRSRYDDDKWMATTQFEPTSARRAFPCFDEPAMKARFSVSLARPKGSISLSNMPRSSKYIEKDNNWEVDVYYPTPKMSTYLLAFVVTKFAYTKEFSESGVEFRVYARYAAKEQTEFAVEIGPKLLDFFNDFFQIDYPLPKQDMIAVPDFSAGGMENWGLITYREVALLYDPKLSSLQHKAVIATIIAHELAHQVQYTQRNNWFGNLVTPAWWDDLWLNEGFATYMASVATAHLFPKWHSMDGLLNSLHIVFELDSLKTSHPISVNVDDPSQIRQLFDAISYGKGSTIIRMMVNFIGNDVFRRGLKTYFEEIKYKNAVQDDLWRHMTKAIKRKNSTLDVKTIMDTWTLQTGYPVVTVKRDTFNQTATVTQKIFNLIPEDGENNNKNSVKWEIPLSFTTETNPNFENVLPVKWMHNSTDENNVIFTKEDGIPLDYKWLIFNLQQTGYYRVNYQNENWILLSNQLMKDHKVIHVYNRAQLIDDAFNLARSGEIDYEIPLNLSRYLNRETELLPWQAAVRNFGYIDSMLSKTDVYGLWMNYLSKLIKPHYDKIGFTQFPNTDDNYIKLEQQSIFVSAACGINVDGCINTCVSIYENWIENISSISPHLRETVLCKAIHRGNIKEWTSVWERYLSSNLETEKLSFLRVLTCTQQPWILTKMLNMIMVPGDSVRLQDIGFLAYGIAANKLGRYMFFNFIRNNAEELHDLGEGILSMMASIAMSNFNTPFELNEMKEFISKHSSLLKAKDRTLSQLIEKTESNISWMNKNLDRIEAWLEEEAKSKLKVKDLRLKVKDKILESYNWL